MAIFSGLFNSLASKIAVGLAVTLALTVGGALWLHNRDQARIENLLANQALLEHAVTTQTNTINQLQANIRLFATENSTLQATLDRAEEERDQYLAQVRAAQIRLLAVENPQEAEAIINDQTNRLFDAIEADTRQFAR